MRNFGRTSLHEVSITSEPSNEPVVLSDMTDGGDDFARIDYSNDDSLITAMLTSARVMVEKYLNRALITQTRRAWYKSYGRELNLPYAPVQSVTTVKTIAEDGTSDTLTSGTDYYVKGVDDKYIDFGGVTSIPAGHSVNENTSHYGLDVVYVCGYGDDASDVPDPIKEAIKRLTLYLYEQREDVITGTSRSVMPVNIETILLPYKNGMI